MEGKEAENSFIEIQSRDFSSRASEAAIYPAARGTSETKCFLVGEKIQSTLSSCLCPVIFMSICLLSLQKKAWLASGKKGKPC